jgi:iron complex outermembrane receptor protein
MPLPAFVMVDVDAGYMAKAFGVRVKLSDVFNKLSYHAHNDDSINPVALRQVMVTPTYRL